MKTIYFAYYEDAQGGFRANTPDAPDGEYVPADVASALLSSLTRIIGLVEGGFRYEDIAWQSAHAEARAAITKAEESGATR